MGPRGDLVGSLERALTEIVNGVKGGTGLGVRGVGINRKGKK